MFASATIARKDLRILLRDRAALMWVAGFPVAFALLFGSVMKTSTQSSAPPFPLVVVVPDSPDRAGIAARAALLERSGLRITRASENEARSAVRRGEAVAFVQWPQAQTADPIVLGIDPSRQTEAALLRTLIAAAGPGAAPASRVETVDVIRVQSGPKSGFEIAFPAMILWGLLGCAATFAVAMVSERSSGTLLRLRAAPIARSAILGGKAGACVAACLANVLVLTLIGRVALGVRIAEPAKYAAAVAAAVVCFAGLTMVLSVLGRTDQAVAGAGWATTIAMAMFGGAMIPLSIMPPWLLSVRDFSPVKWGIVALEGATWRGFGWGELSRPLLLLVAVGVCGFASGIAVLWSWRDA